MMLEELFYLFDFFNDIPVAIDATIDTHHIKNIITLNVVCDSLDVKLIIHIINIIRNKATLNK